LSDDGMIMGSIYTGCGVQNNKTPNLQISAS